MKKKIIFLLVCIMIVSVMLILISCGLMNSGSTETTTSKSETVDIYSTINALLNNVDYPITLTTKTTENGYQFMGQYVIAKTGDIYSAEYSYEKASTFGFTDKDEIILPAGFKTTYTGNIKVKNGIIIEKNGAESNVSVQMLTAKGFALSESALSGVKTSNNTFSAEITSFNSVTGLDVDAESASINITYTDEKITKMTLSYSTSFYKSEITYTFS